MLPARAGAPTVQKRAFGPKKTAPKKLAPKKPVKSKSASGDSCTHAIQEEVEKFTKKLELEKQKLKVLEADLQRANDEYAERKSAFAGAATDAPSANPSEVKAAKLAVTLSQTKLGKLSVGYNASLKEIKERKDKIDKLRRERLTITEVHKQLTKEIIACEAALTQTTESYQARMKLHEKTEAEIHSLFEQRAAENDKYLAEAEALTNAIEQIEIEQTETKTKHGKSSRSNEEASKNGEEEKPHVDESSVSSEMDSRVLKPLVMLLAFENSIQKRKIAQSRKEIEVFNCAKETIKATTSITDIDEIVDIFQKVHEQNYSLVTYINNISKEIETITEENNAAKAEIDKFQSMVSIKKQKRNKVLSDLESKIESIDSVVQKSTEEIEHYENNMRAILPYIYELAVELNYLRNESLGRLRLDIQGDDVLQLPDEDLPLRNSTTLTDLATLPRTPAANSTEPSFFPGTDQDMKNVEDFTERVMTESSSFNLVVQILYAVETYVMNHADLIPDSEKDATNAQWLADDTNIAVFHNKARGRVVSELASPSAGNSSKTCYIESDEEFTERPFYLEELKQKAVVKGVRVAGNASKTGRLNQEGRGKGKGRKKSVKDGDVVKEIAVPQHVKKDLLEIDEKARNDPLRRKPSALPKSKLAQAAVPAQKSKLSSAAPHEKECDTECNEVKAKASMKPLPASVKHLTSDVSKLHGESLASDSDSLIGQAEQSALESQHLEHEVLSHSPSSISGNSVATSLGRTSTASQSGSDADISLETAEGDTKA